MKKRKTQFKEIERVLAGTRRSNVLKGGWVKEVELNIENMLECHKNSRWGQIVARLLRAGSTRITIQNNPLWDKKHRWRDNFYIFRGYSIEQNIKTGDNTNEGTKKGRKIKQ